MLLDMKRWKQLICSLSGGANKELRSGGNFERKGIKCTGGLMSSESVHLLRSFYEQENPKAPKPHRALTPRVNEPSNKKVN